LIVCFVGGIGGIDYHHLVFKIILVINIADILLTCAPGNQSINQSINLALPKTKTRNEKSNGHIFM
jgi:hypothetical protein